MLMFNQKAFLSLFCRISLLGFFAFVTLLDDFSTSYERDDNTNYSIKFISELIKIIEIK